MATDRLVDMLMIYADVKIEECPEQDARKVRARVRVVASGTKF